MFAIKEIVLYAKDMSGICKTKQVLFIFILSKSLSISMQVSLYICLYVCLFMLIYSDQILPCFWNSKLYRVDFVHY